MIKAILKSKYMHGSLATIITIIGIYLPVAASQGIWPFTKTKIYRVNVEIVLDVSDEMLARFEDIDSARDILIGTVSTVTRVQVAGTDNVALRRLGSSCEEPDNNTLLFEFDPGYKERIRDSLSEVKFSGKPTVMDALFEAASDFNDPERFKGQLNAIILITGPPEDCSFENWADYIVQRLEDQDIKVKIWTVGIDLSSEEMDIFNYLAERTGGRANRIEDIDELRGQLAVAYEVLFGSLRRQIHVIPVDGSGHERPLFEDEFSNSSPAWSPDGSKIAFTSVRNGQQDIYIIDADGSNLQQVTNSSAFDDGPAWAPDGSRIAFYRGNIDPSVPPNIQMSSEDWNQDVYIVNTDGTNLVRLTSHHQRDSFPKFSPDGRIAFQSLRDGNGNYEIYVMNPDGSNKIRLTDNKYLDTKPSWSPDGTKIAFTSDRDLDLEEEIYVMNADGSDQKLIIDRNALDSFPEWSPDGSRIIFSSRNLKMPEGVLWWNVYSMKLDGSDLRQHTMNRGQSANVSSSPDGRLIAFDTAWEVQQ